MSRLRPLDPSRSSPYASRPAYLTNCRRRCAQPEQSSLYAVRRFVSPSPCDAALRRIAINKIQDGAAILWRENQPVNEAADTAAEGAGSRTASTTRPLPARMRPPATAQKPQFHNRREGGLLVPVATMQGHSGVNTWRLAVHEFDSRRGGNRTSTSSCDEHGSVAATESGRKERDKDWRGLTLLATGGNDGACKLWDLGFAGACERRQRLEKRRDGDLRCLS